MFTHRFVTFVPDVFSVRTALEHRVDATCRFTRAARRGALAVPILLTDGGGGLSREVFYCLEITERGYGEDELRLRFIWKWFLEAERDPGCTKAASRVVPRSQVLFRSLALPGCKRSALTCASVKFSRTGGTMAFVPCVFAHLMLQKGSMPPPHCHPAPPWLLGAVASCHWDTACDNHSPATPPCSSEPSNTVTGG